MTPLLAAALIALAPGTYTNEEQVYFAVAAKQAALPWVGIRVAVDGSVARVDAFGAAVAGPLPDGFAPSADGYSAALAGAALSLQRARAFRCWATMPRRAPKPDGSEDWWFAAGLALHDRGGRVVATTDETPPQTFTLRMRNVVWPSGPNQPSLVLYVHRDDPDHAASYSWADPDAKRVGINLRWMQASCTRVVD